MQIQQGDVIIVSVNSIPADAKKLPHNILAQGESTGHSHVALADDVELFEKDGILYFSAPSGTGIKHQTHNIITVPPGKFKFGIISEYDYDTEERRRIID